MKQARLHAFVRILSLLAFAAIACAALSLCLAHFGSLIGLSRHGPFTSAPLLPGEVGTGTCVHALESPPGPCEGCGAVSLAVLWLLRRLWPALPRAAAAAVAMLLWFSTTRPKRPFGRATNATPPGKPCELVSRTALPRPQRWSRAVLRSLLVPVLGAVIAALGMRSEQPRVAIALTVLGAAEADGVPFTFK